MKKVIIASKNPVKIAAATEAFKKMLPNETFEFTGISAPSGVSDQPSSDDETYQGASNRAKNASELAPDADFWVGLEGGVDTRADDMVSAVWIVVRGADGRVGEGHAASYVIPQKVADLVRQGKELGEADDIVFGKTNSKQSSGASGLLTGDVIPRAAYYEQAAVFALIPFKNPELYPV